MIVFDASRITLARECRQLTAAQLADKIGVSSQQITQWERGEVTPSASNLTKIMNAVDAPPTFFYVHSVASDAQQENQA